MSGALERFALEVGSEGPVCCAGGRTQWDVGGEPGPGVREVSAPVGVVVHQPAEMIVRVRAGTPVAQLAEVLAEGGQMVALEADPGATVGGVISVGRSGPRRLGRGPVRDTVLEMTAVTAGGELVRAGAPLVKNVTGFDLCRLFTGSLGTLAFLAEVVLRCHPIPETERWWVGEGIDPFEVHAALYRPLSVLWDGARTWVGLAGHRVDVAEQAREVLGDRLAETAGPPVLPGPGRRSLRPGDLRHLPARLAGDGSWIAEVGVGTLHCTTAVAARLGAPSAPSSGIVSLHRRIKHNFDPAGRLNPGRQPLSGTPA